MAIEASRGRKLYTIVVLGAAVLTGLSLMTGHVAAQTTPSWTYPWCGQQQPYISSIFDHEYPVLNNPYAALTQTPDAWYHVALYNGDRRPDCRYPPWWFEGTPWLPGTPTPTTGIPIDHGVIANYRKCVAQPTPTPTISALCWRYDMHPGWDYAMVFEPVFAVDSGTVGFVGHRCAAGKPYGSSLYIQLDHTDGTYQTRYGHLSVALVQENEAVFKGQRIGTSGRTGLGPTHPHLHFESRTREFIWMDVFYPYGWTSKDPDPWDEWLGPRSERMFEPALWAGIPGPDCDGFGTGGPYFVDNDACPTGCGDLLYADDADPAPEFECTACGTTGYGGYGGTFKHMPPGSGNRATWRFCGVPPGTYRVEVSLPVTSGRAPHEAEYSINGAAALVSQWDAVRAVHREPQWGFDDWLDVGMYPASNVLACGVLQPGVEIQLVDDGEYIDNDPRFVPSVFVVDAVRIAVCPGPFKGATPTPIGGGGRGQPRVGP